MSNSELYNEDHEATYCPEDNKIRLYVGRVPRDEYQTLRAQGWKSTPKQSEAGGGEFAATWTPEREDMAKDYAGEIGDEDMSPEDRAVLRAERFAGYRDNRTSEALDHADSYESGPSVHGYQNKGKAVKEADRHDKQATKALTQWDKAHYWTSRTAGVISNRLYLSRADVRMGRIKELETSARKTEGREDERGQRWNTHYKMRLSYEEQMLASVGGRASVVTMEKGGTYGGRLIVKINKSNATGNVVSLGLRATVEEVFASVASSYHTSALDREKNKHKGRKWGEFSRNIERETSGDYVAPTPSTLNDLKEWNADRTRASKAANASKPKLINPTNEDAERLQDIWNKSNASRRCFGKDEKKVIYLTQSQFTGRGIKAKDICEGGEEYRGGYNTGDRNAPVCCKVRAHYDQIIVITDKPQNPMPARVWVDIHAESLESAEKNLSLLVSASQKRWREDFTQEENEAWKRAAVGGWVQSRSCSQFGLSYHLQEMAREAGLYAQTV